MSTTLGEICNFITDGKHGDCNDQLDSEYYFLSAKDIKDGKIYFEEGRKITEEDFLDTDRRTRFEVDDILITNTGASVGRFAIAKPDARIRKTTFQKSVSLLKANKKIVLPLYLYYHLLSKKNEIINLGGGSAQANLLLRDIRAFKINLPSFPIQRKIASILSAYDELIENNNQRIKLLEEMAEEIYKEWFVRLRFPGYESTNFFDAKGKVLAQGTNAVKPECWEKKPINSIVNIISGYAFKTETFDSEGSYKLVTIKNVQDGFFVTETTDYIRELPKNLKDNCKLKDRDIILSLTGNIGRICIVYGENYLLNQRVAKLEAKETFLYEFVYLMFRSKFLRATLENLSNGAAQQNLSPIEMGKLEFPVPKEEVLKKFSALTNPFFDEIILLNKKNQLLQQTRDLLLPRLISGKLSVEHLLDEEENLSIAAEPELSYSKK